MYQNKVRQGKSDGLNRAKVESMFGSPKASPAERPVATPVSLPSLPRGISGSSVDLLSNEVLRSKIENEDSISGQFNKLMFTHNTSASGLLGILASNRMLATVERNVNFRYGIDSRYAGGVTLIMKDDFYKKHKDYYIQDLYNQRLHLMGDKEATLGNSTEENISDLLQCVSKSTDFRKVQMEALTGSLMPISRMGKDKEKILSMRYKLSLVNPQVRIPWSINKITINDIDKIIIADQIDNEIMSSGYADKAKSELTRFSTYLSGLAGDGQDRHVRNEVASALNASSGGGIINKYKVLRRSGFIEVVNTNGAGLFSHRAGRISKRGKRDEDALTNAARIGLDIHANYFEEAMNNSPSALSLSVLTQFEKVYFNHVLDRIRSNP